MGLGLAITRSIVEAHGGRVRAESEVGVGTLLRIWLPAAAAVDEGAARGAERAVAATGNRFSACAAAAEGRRARLLVGRAHEQLRRHAMRA